MDISFRVTKLNFREETTTITTTKGILIPINSPHLQTRVAPRTAPYLYSLSSIGTIWLPTFSFIRITLRKSLQLSVSLLTNPEVCPQYSLLNFSIAKQHTAPWNSFPLVPLYHNAVMEFLASALLYSSILQFSFFQVVSTFESNFRSEYPALKSLLIISSGPAFYNSSALILHNHV